MILQAGIESALARMAERRVAEVVRQRQRFGEVFVQPQLARQRTGDLRHLYRVRQPRAVMVAGRRKEHLRLVLQAPEGLAVDNPVSIVLERRSDVILRFWT
jgi:hypothetical protein